MKLRVTGLFMASMLCSTAVTPVLAQEAVDAQACSQLDVIITENPEFQQVWLDEARMAVDAADAQLCVQYVTQAERALMQGEEAERIEGRIVVTQEPPTVDVVQPAPEVIVSQPDPTVSVRQPQPEIIVRQVPPTIRIEMPNPVVTIDQPQPEIIVRMPDPLVSVDTPQPEIEVNQAAPQVSVEQGEAQVDVALDDTVRETQQEAAAVQVEQGTPQVRLQQQVGEAQVDLQQAQPNVVYEPAEPQIEFTGGDQPQVQFTESGEPNVSFVEGGTEREATGEMAMGTEADWRGDRALLVAPAVQVEGFQPADISQISVENLMDADVYSANNEDIGTVSDAIATQGGQVEYIVLDIGGFLGIGAREVALGMDEVTVMQAGEELRIYVDATREQLEQMPEYEGA